MQTTWMYVEPRGIIHPCITLLPHSEPGNTSHFSLHKHFVEAAGQAAGVLVSRLFIQTRTSACSKKTSGKKLAGLMCNFNFRKPRDELLPDNERS